MTKKKSTLISAEGLEVWIEHWQKGCERNNILATVMRIFLCFVYILTNLYLQIIKLPTLISPFLVSCGSGFVCVTNREWLTPPYLIETVSLSCTVTQMAIIVMPGCECQCIHVSWALLGSMCQHLIVVSACTEPGQPHMSIFTHARTWKEPQLHNRIAR